MANDTDDAGDVGEGSIGEEFDIGEEEEEDGESRARGRDLIEDGERRRHGRTALPRTILPFGGRGNLSVDILKSERENDIAVLGVEEPLPEELLESLWVSDEEGLCITPWRETVPC